MSAKLYIVPIDASGAKSANTLGVGVLEAAIGVSFNPHVVAVAAHLAFSP
ncbi:hypothetical protein EV401DRAFT_2068928 [Pisolithus croceorrhizus]|nr:hypothetical protein EV401DRAFT_2068928 [Pisolithus croceorrhizus]